MTEQIAVLGAGSWGATLANLLAEKEHAITLWEFDPTAARQLSSSRTLKILPELQLHASVLVTSDLAQALKNKPILISATPSQFVRATMKLARATHAIHPDAMAISVSKGLEEKTLKRMCQVIMEETGWSSERVGVLAGPSHAEEVCRHVPTATVVASSNPLLSARAQSLFAHDYFRVYTNHDPVGIELAGALKNVFAIACGISDGLRLGDNTVAAIMTRGLNEMARIGVRQGAQLNTFYGLAGMGDLIVTCLSAHSRNRTFGQKVGQGKTPQQALSEMTMVVEGYKTCPSAYAMAQASGVESPLIREIYSVLYEGKDPRVSLRDLMTREMHTEQSSEA